MFETVLADCNWTITSMVLADQSAHSKQDSIVGVCNMWSMERLVLADHDLDTSLANMTVSSYDLYA